MVQKLFHHLYTYSGAACRQEGDRNTPKANDGKDKDADEDESFYVGDGEAGTTKTKTTMN